MQTKQIYTPPEKPRSFKDFLLGLLSGLGLSASVTLLRKCTDKPAESGADDSQISAEPPDTALDDDQTAAAESGQQSAAADGTEQPADGQILAQFQNDIQQLIMESQNGDSQNSAQSLQEALDALAGTDTLNAEQRQAIDALKNIVLAYINAITEANKKKTPSEHNAELNKGKTAIDQAAAGTDYLAVAEQLKTLLDKWRLALPAPPPQPLTPAERRARQLDKFKAKVNSYERMLKTLLRYAATYNLTEEDETNITERLDRLTERDFEDLPDAEAVQAYENDLSNFIDTLRGNDIDPMPK